MAPPSKRLMVINRGGLMASCTAWMALQSNAHTVDKSGGSRGFARNKNRNARHQWDLAIALDCNSMVVDTMSWRGMVTHLQKNRFAKQMFYRTELHCLHGPAVQYVWGEQEWWINGKRRRLNRPALVSVDRQQEWWVQWLETPHPFH